MSETATATIDPIAAAIAQAQKSAEAIATAQVGTGIAPLAAANTQVAEVARPGQKLVMGQMTGGISVDIWLGVKEFGFIIGPNKVLYSGEIDVTIDLSAVQPCFSIKFGNHAQYLKTYDMVTEVKGGGWGAAVHKAQSIDSRARQYRSCDIPMTVLSDVSVTDQKTKQETLLLAEGSTLGYSTSTTGWGPWEKFWTQCEKLGLTGETVQARLGFKSMKNASNNVWGVVTYELVLPTNA